ncbi:MYND-type domain-containing protein [Mycena sanguinolenta]|uniref:MYND-type domain-containing protein n=1 Tax=Mycena sanguinolenta TaxID=230812 RepID=A0A8H6ZF21_9AGAR|nr:MYND-type domain-containing protein [Mycena sanguinolenta]
MKEPKVGMECVCMEEDYDSEEEAKKSLMRCSTCKNRFYCSARCQKNDWKQHKWNCSALPVNGLPAATVVDINDEFDGAVKRVSAILKEVADALKDDKKKLSASMLAPLLRIPAELPSDLQYTRAIEDSGKFKYRLPILTASRLFLISFASALDPGRRQKYEEWFAGMYLPMDFCEMYGPKIIGRPADLSPGEYAMLAQTMPIWVMPEVEKTKEERAKRTGEGQGAPDQDTEEVDGMHWIWLAVALKRAYSATTEKRT